MYVNLFACPVPNKNKDAYIEQAPTFADIIRTNGCTRYVEVWAAEVPNGELTSFIKAVQYKEDENVVSGSGEWPDAKTCNEGMKAVIPDPKMAEMEMPFDGKRLIFGEFKAVVNV